MSEISTVFYNQVYATEWDDLVHVSVNGTLFHLRTFLAYHPPNRFSDASLCFYKKDRLAAVFPAARVIIKNEKWLISHPGASFGGYVYIPSVTIRDLSEIVDKTIEHARAEGYSGIKTTLPSRIYYSIPDDSAEFLLRIRNFTYDKQELSSTVALSNLPSDPWENFSSRTYRAIRKANRSGIQVRISNDLRSFYSILKKNLKLRHNVSPTHTREEIIALHKIFPEKILLFGAFLGRKMVGGLVLFLCNVRTCLAFYISHDEAFQKYRPVDKLMSEVVRWARDNGFHYLDFGTFTLNMVPNWGLGRFKEKFLAKGVFRNTLVLKL